MFIYEYYEFFKKEVHTLPHDTFITFSLQFKSLLYSSEVFFVAFIISVPHLGLSDYTNLNCSLTQRFKVLEPSF